MTEKRRISWYILVRLVVVSIFLALTIILNVKYSHNPDQLDFTRFLELIVATYVFSLLSLFLLRFDRLLPRLAHAQIVWDLVLVTLLILLTGGIGSPYPFLYLICIVNASILLSRREALYIAGVCAITYGAIVDLQFYGKLAPLGLSQDSARQYGAPQILYEIFLNTLAFFLTAFLTGYLAEKSRTSEEALKSREIDFTELDRLNSSIVANLNSGLLTLNTDGRIRVFNQFAETLTGVSQAEAYDRYLHEIFPSMCYLGGTIDSVQRGEFTFQSKRRGDRTIGFKSVPLSDASGNRTGVIFIFQDLTQLKTMEDDLKKADRLSAIGKLSAHIAHEIRNPLASISGSVQLLAQGEGIDPKDKKLIDIVVRETDRLNTLIQDFLSYARPMKPQKGPVSLKELLGSLQVLIETDPRFQKVRASFSCDRDIVLQADHDQLEQVFWNLLVNAAESMPDGGDLQVSVSEHPGSFGGPVKAKIVVTDTGCGIEREKLGRVFEPFFTSKKGGTGLGLATVYRIVDAHGGIITVDSMEGKGTTFTVYLPVGEQDFMEDQAVCSHVF